VFTLNAIGAGNSELGAALTAGDITLVTEFSDTLIPFVPGGASPAYVRVRVDNYTLDSFLIQVLGINDKTVAASAVAGPSPTLVAHACDVAPMMVCGDPSGDADTSDGDFFGYEYHELQVLKTAAAGGSFEVGPGNFQLVRFDDPGGAAVREGMAGDYDGCATSGDDVTTEPGGTIGPVVQGFNTRFGEYTGPMSGMETVYPPDVNVTEVDPLLDYQNIDADPEFEIVEAGTTTEITAADLAAMLAPWNYDYYQTRVSMGDYTHPPPAPPDGSGAFGRRVLTVPIGDCSSTTSGAGDVGVLGFGCFFLLQKAVQKGNEAELYGEFIDGCDAYGPPGADPGSGTGPYIIQLYEDVGSLDS